ncbi:MAG TPA: lysophospholipid acyltransferase family protein [Burkholderiaceae bacterium]|nr:lysophospholipid acyltransferase family protein [Burkholderiaceae bacterium]
MRLGSTLYQATLYVLAPLAVTGVFFHVLWGLVFALLVFPVLPQPGRNRVIRFWSRVLLLIIGVRLDVRGEAIPPELAATGLIAGSRGRLVVANHISWLDVYTLDALVPTRFVAKAEIARWPMVGWLVALVGTLFVERGRRHAVHGVNRIVGDHLQRSETIGVFAEGTTTDGTRLLPFHANLIQPALDHGAEVRPLAIRFTQYGRPSLAASYEGDTNLVQSLWRIVTAPHLVAEVHWLPAVDPTITNRHAAARAARAAIAAAIDVRAEPETEGARVRARAQQAGADEPVQPTPDAETAPW